MADIFQPQNINQASSDGSIFGWLKPMGVGMYEMVWFISGPLATMG